MTTIRADMNDPEYQRKVAEWNNNPNNPNAEANINGVLLPRGGIPNQGKPGPNNGVKDPPRSDTDLPPGMLSMMGTLQTMHETPEQSESQTSNFANASTMINEHLQGAAQYGMVKRQAMEAMKKGGSKMSQMGRREDKDFRPKGPGTDYLNHLVDYNMMGEKMAAQRKENEQENGNIFTDQPEAAKTALRLIGVYSEKNPSGLPIDFMEAKSLWFGKKEVDKMEEAGFRTEVEQGDQNIDPKRVRKFVNYDGSLTWEILNQDKTVQSRFTMGDYAGTKVFAQGGYKTFAELLKKAKKKKGPDVGGEFDAIRGSN